MLYWLLRDPTITWLKISIIPPYYAWQIPYYVANQKFSVYPIMKKILKKYDVWKIAFHYKISIVLCYWLHYKFLSTNTIYNRYLFWLNKHGHQLDIFTKCLVTKKWITIHIICRLTNLSFWTFVSCLSVILCEI